MLHVGVLVFLLWHPPPVSAEATPPPAIDVELVSPAEAVSESQPPVEETHEEAEAESAAEAGTASAVPPPPPQPVAPVPTVAETPPTQMPPEADAPRPAPGATAAASPPAGGVESPAEAPPIPLARPRVRGLSAPASAPSEAVSTLTADSGEVAEGTAPPAASAEPDVADLGLGPRRSAERFYLEAMLGSPGMAQARAMLETLPPEKRLAQTCNIEALAQVGNAGEGLAPDVVMAEAYARSQAAGTHLTAPGAIFRSGDRWYGLAFDCTLSDDLTSVTAFSYRLGTDVTDAVLARLGRT